MSKIIGITGATGFIGARVFDILKKNGCKIRLLVRKKKIEQMKSNLSQNVEVRDGNLEDIKSLNDFCKGLHTIVHCAALISATSEKQYKDSNVIGTKNIIEAISKNNIKTFIHLSSLSANKPAIGGYAMTKKQSEDYVLELQKKLKNQCNCIILRPPAVYGPGDKVTLNLFRSIHKMSLLIVPGEKNTRYSMIFVDDIAHAIRQIIDDKKNISGIFELDDGKIEGYSWLDIKNICQSVTKKNITLLCLPKWFVYIFSFFSSAIAFLTRAKPLLPIDKARIYFAGNWLCQNNRLEQNIKWKAKTKAESGFQITLDWYKNKGWL